MLNTKPRAIMVLASVVVSAVNGWHRLGVSPHIELRIVHVCCQLGFFLI
jgi:hypothetical protein